MYNSNAVQAIGLSKMFTTGSKFFELVKLALKPSVSKDNNSKEYLPYIVNATSKGYTVLDIGSHKKEYLFNLSKIARLPGRLIAFETSPAIYNYFSKMKQLMNLENITIEMLEMETVDAYCSLHFIVPSLIKFKLQGNGDAVLRGAKEILRKYQPEILVECAEGTVSRETLLSTFKFLTDLGYSGYFILADMKIPLANFDFNTYQNKVLGSYCNNFIFK